MKLAKTMLKTAAAAMVLALAACSGGTHTERGVDNTVVALAAGRLTALLPGQAQEAPDARQILNARLIERSSTPLLLVVLEQADSALTMIPLANNLGTEQWRDVSGGGLLRRDGILVGTRGLGNDLYSAEIGPLVAALRAGGGTDVQRVNRTLDGQNQIVATQFLCDVRPVGTQTLDFFGTRYATRVFEESCQSAEISFVNRYWIDSSGMVRRSRERVSDVIGIIDVQVLKR